MGETCEVTTLQFHAACPEVVNNIPGAFFTEILVKHGLEALAQVYANDRNRFVVTAQNYQLAAAVMEYNEIMQEYQRQSYGLFARILRQRQLLEKRNAPITH